MRLLIVEDHRKINDLLARFARQDGHETVQAFSAEEAFAALASKTFDAVVTDLMLPDLQGEDLIRSIRAQSDLYIMVVSAKIDVRDRIDVLSLGADDYLTKPFSVNEVMVKLKNVEKRVVTRSPVIRSYHGGELRIVPLQRQVLLLGDPVDLTAHEYDVLWALASRPKRILSRDQIIDLCFADSEAFDRVIDAHIKNIRKKLGDSATEPRYLKTHYGVGYQFVGKADD
ncbi:MAG: response regulator transcription factor [Candidatus Izemoplasmatales bacterium]